MRNWYEKLVWEVSMRSWYEKLVWEAGMRKIFLHEIQVYSTSPDENNQKLEGAMNYAVAWGSLNCLDWVKKAGFPLVGKWRDWTLLLCFHTNTTFAQANRIAMRQANFCTKRLMLEAWSSTFSSISRPWTKHKLNQTGWDGVCTNAGFCIEMKQIGWMNGHFFCLSHYLLYQFFIRDNDSTFFFIHSISSHHLSLIPRHNNWLDPFFFPFNFIPPFLITRHNNWLDPFFFFIQSHPTISPHTNRLIWHAAFDPLLLILFSQLRTLPNSAFPAYYRRYNSSTPPSPSPLFMHCPTFLSYAQMYPFMCHIYSCLAFFHAPYSIVPFHPYMVFTHALHSISSILVYALLLLIHALHSIFPP